MTSLIGQIRQIHYGYRYIKACKPAYQHRHCKIIKIGKGGNCLVQLKGGLQAVIPLGNLIESNTYIYEKANK